MTWATGSHYPVYVAWSADGTTLSFRRANDGHVVSAPVAGGTALDRSLEAASQPCVSSGGQKLAFMTDARSVVVTGIDGSNRQAVHASAKSIDVEAFR